MTEKTGKQIVLDIAREKQVFRAGDVDMNPNHVHKYIERLRNEGLIERIGYGLYSLKDRDLTENTSLVEVAVKVPTAVFCLLTALRFHELTTQAPFQVWLAIERGTRYPKIDTVQTRIFRFAPNVYSPGIETHKIEGVDVKVYCPAKTVADCFYYQNKIGLDVAIEALQDTWQSRKTTIDELYEFARIRNVHKLMHPYLTMLSL